MITKCERSMSPELTAKLKQYVVEIIGCCQEVHKCMGPFLNEYMYQDALNIMFEEQGIPFIKEYYFHTEFHGQAIKHPHKVDFLVKDNLFVECKAITAIGNEQRQQLWNYMRLAKVRVGILYNFAPIKDQCEKYYYDPEKETMTGF